MRWNPIAAVIAYDAQIAASGISTVFDSLRAGAEHAVDGVAHDLHDLADALKIAQADKLLRADHKTHLRCEIAAGDVTDMARAFIENHRIDLISIMDHTPGQRQFRDLAKMKIYYERHGIVGEDKFAKFVEDRQAMHKANAKRHRADLVALAHEHNAALASHDDGTLEEVDEAISDKASIAEFPTTIAAAKASHAAGIKVLMGAPNIVRGGSHSGNVAAEDLARENVLDILSSDYVPASLLLAAFELPTRVPHITLPQAITMVTKNPADASGLHDRGEIAKGKRADLARVACRNTIPVVRILWREGVRVI